MIAFAVTDLRWGRRDVTTRAWRFPTVCDVVSSPVGVPRRGHARANTNRILPSILVVVADDEFEDAMAVKACVLEPTGVARWAISLVIVKVLVADIPVATSVEQAPARVHGPATSRT